MKASVVLLGLFLKYPDEKECITETQGACSRNPKSKKEGGLVLFVASSLTPAGVQHSTEII